MTAKTDPTLENPQATGHEYDGITEYDNPMPRWWTRIFWGTFFFSIGYLFHYSAGQGVGVNAGYEEEMAEVRAHIAAEALKHPVSEQSLEQLLADATSVGAGSKVYTARCAVCHGPLGEGLIGPNLTDSAWLHGEGKLMDLYGTVSAGVLTKGMPAWERQLTPTELRQVVAFAGSLRGKNLPGKRAEGKTPAAAPTR
jgi:cytochrome c oxidase cbb3-type subunit III